VSTGKKKAEACSRQTQTQRRGNVLLEKLVYRIVYVSQKPLVLGRLPVAFTLSLLRLRLSLLRPCSLGRLLFRFCLALERLAFLL
jgi:hypothetical protein